MNAARTTGIFVGVAAVLVLLAFVTAPGSGRSERFSDESELFFPEFTDPGQAVALEVIAVDEKNVEGKLFKVERENGLWTIPSHHGYPADAKDRMAKAAGLLIALRKGAARSDSRADFADLGVVDPRDATGEVKGLGTLITFRDENETVVAELIIGNEVEGRMGQRYVRIPGQRRTYMAELDADLSTRFADWVETDLLKLNAPDIEKFVFDNYSIDEEAGVIRTGERIVAAKKDGAWTVEGVKEETEEVVTEPLDEAGRLLDDLRIVGVRPKPPGLDKHLMANSLQGQIIRQSLQGRGYFLANDGKLYANEGDLLITTNEGVTYTLRFGEIVYGTAEEVSSGSEDAAKKDEGGGDDEKKDPGKLKANRYLMVTADFDLSFFPKPEGEPYPEEEATKRRKAIRDIRELDIQVAKYKVEKKELPKAIADALDEGTKDLGKDPWGNDYVVEPLEEDRYRVVSHGADGAKDGEGVNADISSENLSAEEVRLDLGAKVEAWKKKLATGRDRARDLSDRFAPWYYVIDGESFDKLKLGRKDVVQEKKKEEDTAEPTDGPGPGETEDEPVKTPDEPGDGPKEPEKDDGTKDEPEPDEPKPDEPKKDEPK
jgi:hypothetical protein